MADSLKQLAWRFGVAGKGSAEEGKAEAALRAALATSDSVCPLRLFLLKRPATRDGLPSRFLVWAEDQAEARELAARGRGGREIPDFRDRERSSCEELAVLKGLVAPEVWEPPLFGGGRR